MMIVETGNSFYPPHFYHLPTHYGILVHVDPGNGKLTLLSTLSLSYTPLLFMLILETENSLYFLNFYHLRQTTTCSCTSWKRKTCFTFHTFSTLTHSPSCLCTIRCKIVYLFFKKKLTSKHKHVNLG